MEEKSLAQHFETHFRVALAHTRELMEQAHRLRYEVYCKEFQFEREEDCPGGMERDDYDIHSLHGLVVHRSTQTAAGCFRLIRPPHHNPVLPLPFEKYCGHSLYDGPMHPDNLPRTNLCEVSRVAVASIFRRRQGESESRFGRLSSVDFTEIEMRVFPLLSVSLFAAGAALMVLAQQSNLFVMMEMRLARLLQRSGLNFTQVGHPMDYHGIRAAFFITIDQVLSGMKGEMRDMYDFIYRDLEAEVTHARLNLSRPDLGIRQRPSGIYGEMTGLHYFDDGDKDPS